MKIMENQQNHVMYLPNTNQYCTAV